jgi:hypothetical protein
MPTVLVCIAVVNMLSLYLIAQPLLDYTAVGDWYNALDRWSRTNGFADGGTGAVACVFFLWPFIPLHFIRKYRASKSVAPRTRVDTHH